MRDPDEAFRIDDIDRIVTPDDPYLLRDDSIRDPVAINVAVNGYRKVALTHHERVNAALAIRYRYCQDCADNNTLPDLAAVVELIRENLALPSVEAAVDLVLSLPKDVAATRRAEYWAGYRHKKNRQRREAYQLRKAS